MALGNDWRREMHQVLDRLGLPFICRRDVAADGDCFYDSVLALLEDPEIQKNIAGRAKGITSITMLRYALAHFMETNDTLHSLEVFIVHRNNTLRQMGLS